MDCKGGAAMAEVLHDLGRVIAADGKTYHVRACGSPLDDIRWQGWLEFEPADGGETIRSGRETTQPNRADTIYWASGLSLVYIEGALNRALNPLVLTVAEALAEPVFDGPAPPVRVREAPDTSVLNPFSVYRKGEAVLRDQLHALSARHLVNIIRDHQLSEVPVDDLNTMAEAELVELIVANVRIAVNQGAYVPKVDDA
ncbi:MAG: hypothetical protein H0W18_17675 [Acidobacteria bacterium]|nr:hypothetical protein [Acidobacteriota bacterium]